MLSQTDADELLALVKVLAKQAPIVFPQLMQQNQIEVVDAETLKKKFMIDLQRKTLNVHKITYQTRYSSTRLLRLDIDGPAHPNPDGTEVPCPHIHIYREGFELGWAYPLEDHLITNTNDLVKVLIDFLRYNNVSGTPVIESQGGGLV